MATLRLSKNEAAEVLRGAKSEFVRADGDHDFARLRDIDEGSSVLGETEDGGQCCEMQEGRNKDIDKDAQAIHFKFTVVKVLSSTAVDSKHFWGAMSAAAIPSKSTLHGLFMEKLSPVWSQERGGSLLDMGCGDGRIAIQLINDAKQAGGRLDVIGVDVCADGVAAANKLAREDEIPEVAGQPGGVSRASFRTGDITDLKSDDVGRGSFDVVLCQLVISVVGGIEQRKGLLRSARALLRPGGVLLLSTSGASEAVNASYAALYEADFAVTKEHRTYLSRGKNGEVLYVTHHFTLPELHGLLAEAGFEGVESQEVQEASSRRPEEKAVFFYTAAARPMDASQLTRE